MPRSTKAPAATSPQAKLGAVIKSARDAMRKDAGLNGDIDRIPQLAWLLFLKAFDGLEANREVVETKFRPAIEAPFRWRDWAADPNGRTGEALIEFVNGELLPYLRDLVGTGSHDPRDVLAAVFKETYNRMLSGYLLRDVVNKVNEVNFASADDIHTMAHLYESMLREMRDAAGDSGEFYTPRPVIRFMVHQIDPKLGDTVLDPACGTGGFLVETLEHLRPQVATVKQRRTLEGNLRGIEKKPLPYLLGMMNLLLHEMQQPNIVRGNSLGTPITQIAKRERVDVVLTNPPFGGEEEKSIQANFPEATRTGETAWLFLQLVIRQLKDGGRCGIVVPNGVLFGEGTGARIKEQLLDMCNLHTIVRLPAGVFEPYTDIPTNILFFEKSEPTKEVWYYELPLPKGRKKYSKTKPLAFEEFTECMSWWGGPSRLERKETAEAWRVARKDIEEGGYDLDQRNPRSAESLGTHAPLEVVALAETLGRTAADLVEEISRNLAREGIEGTVGGDYLELGEVLEHVVRQEAVETGGSYRIAGLYSFGRGLIDRGAIDGSSTSYKVLTRLETGDLVASKLGGWEGAISVVPSEYDGYFVSQEFPIFRIRDNQRMDEAYLAGLTRAPILWAEIGRATQGSMARRKRVQPRDILRIKLWLPGIDTQRRVGEILLRVRRLLELEVERAAALRALEPAILNEIVRGPE